MRVSAAVMQHTLALKRTTAVYVRVQAHASVL
jgi:hypothetical protein